MKLNNEFFKDLSETEVAILEVVYSIGPCTAEQVLQDLKGIDLLETMRSLHHLTRRGMLLRPEVDEQILYEVPVSYDALRMQILHNRSLAVEA